MHGGVARLLVDAQHKGVVPVAARGRGVFCQVQPSASRVNLVLVHLAIPAAGGRRARGQAACAIKQAGLREREARSLLHALLLQLRPSRQRLPGVARTAPRSPPCQAHGGLRSLVALTVAT